MHTSSVHRIEIDSKTGELKIFRCYVDGEECLFTSINILQVDGKTPTKPLEQIALELGENIILDSSIGRKIFDI